MPPQIAFVLRELLIAYLFRRDLKEEPPVPGAVWIPLLWLVIIGSREGG
jgi:hypothetical protein